MGIGSNRDAEGAGKAEVSQLEVTIAVDEKVLRLQITVEHSVRVAESDSSKHLVQKRLHLHCGQAAGSLVLVHVFLEVMLEKFENKVQLLLAVHHVLQPDDVLVLQLFQQGNFTDSSRRHSFILSIEADFLESDYLLADAVACFVNHTVCPLSNLFKLRIPVHSSQAQATNHLHAYNLPSF